MEKVAAVATLASIMAIIKRHKLKPDENGEYHITDEMMAEAKALDEVQGVKTPPPDHFDFDGRGWEEVTD